MASRAFPDRTGQTAEFLFFEGRNLGGSQVAALHAVLMCEGGIARSRNQIRRKIAGSKSPGRVYQLIDSCIAAGLLEPLPSVNGSIYPRIKITEAGARAVVAWENHAAAMSARRTRREVEAAEGAARRAERERQRSDVERALRRR